MAIVTMVNERSKSMSDSEIIQLLSEIRDYLTAGNPVWDTDRVREAISDAIEAVREREHDDNPPMEYFESGGR